MEVLTVVSQGSLNDIDTEQNEAEDAQDTSVSTREDFSQLPDNVLEYIFSKIESPRQLIWSACVCRSWQRAVASQPWQAFFLSRWAHETENEYDPTILDTRDSSTSERITGNQYHKDEECVVAGQKEEGTRVRSSVWQKKFSGRMELSQSFGIGRPAIDRLIGHDAGVKVSHIIPEYSALLTGSVDRRLILWDLENGKQIAASSQHAGTIRCVVMDENILVTGSSDGRIRVWKRHIKNIHHSNENIRNCRENIDVCSRLAQNCGASSKLCLQRRKPVSFFPFNVQGERAVVQGGHSGPVSALAITPNLLFSGSWDYTVRIWKRRTVKEMDIDSGKMEIDGEDWQTPATPLGWPLATCLQVVRFDDWIMAMAVHETKLFIAAGSEVHVVEIETQEENHFRNKNNRRNSNGFRGLRHLFSICRHKKGDAVTALKVSLDGLTLFYGTTNGEVCGVDLRGYLSKAHSLNNPYTSHITNSLHFLDDSGVGISSGENTFHLGLSRNDFWYSCNSSVTDIACDYPWLAVSLTSGEVMLLDREKCLYRKKESGAQLSEKPGCKAKRKSLCHGARALSVGHGVAGGAQCVDIFGGWLVSGYENGAIVTWDFHKAQEALRKSKSMRNMRRKARERKRQQHIERQTKQQQRRYNQICNRSNDSEENLNAETEEDGEKAGCSCEISCESPCPRMPSNAVRSQPRSTFSHLPSGQNHDNKVRENFYPSEPNDDLDSSSYREQTTRGGDYSVQDPAHPEVVTQSVNDSLDAAGSGVRIPSTRNSYGGTVPVSSISVNGLLFSSFQPTLRRDDSWTVLGTIPSRGSSGRMINQERPSDS